MQQTQKNDQSVQECIEYLSSYIEMEQLRKPGIVYSISVEDGINPMETRIPPIMLQPFVENSIWHAYVGDDLPIKISIEFKKKGNSLECIVEDFGVGIEETSRQKQGLVSCKQSVGIKNVEGRIALLNDKKSNGMYRLQVVYKKCTGMDVRGTIVIFSMPLMIGLVH